MPMSSQSFLLFFLCPGLWMLGAHGVSIKFYEYQNFTGLHWQSSSSEICNNIFEYPVEINSIRTDTCLIAYGQFDCVPIWSEKHMPGDIKLSKYQLRRYESFHICNEEEGGNQFNLDITKQSEDGVAPSVLESYKNLCLCINVPQYVQNMSDWMINNHHNDMLAYFEPDCSVNKWNPKLIRAGNNGDSRDMPEHQKIDPVTKKVYKIQSLGPNPNSTYFQISCNSSQVFTTEATLKSVETVTEGVVGANADLQDTCQVLSNHLKELQTQKDKGNQNKCNCQNDIPKLQAELTEQIRAVFRQEFGDFIQKLKTVVPVMYA